MISWILAFCYQITKMCGLSEEALILSFSIDNEESNCTWCSKRPQITSQYILTVLALLGNIWMIIFYSTVAKELFSSLKKTC